MLEVFIAWKGESMGKFELGRAPSFGMSCFACMDKETLEPYASLTHAFMFWGAAKHSGSFTIFVLHSSGSSSAVELFLCVSFAFYECFYPGNIMNDVLQHYLKVHSV